jgi:hypothetical protein
VLAGATLGLFAALLAIKCGGGAPEPGYSSSGAASDGTKAGLVTTESVASTGGCDYAGPAGTRLVMTIDFPGGPVTVPLTLDEKAGFTGAGDGFTCAGKADALGLSGKCTGPAGENVPFETLSHPPAAMAQRFGADTTGTLGTRASWLVIVVGQAAVAARASPGRPAEALRGDVRGTSIVFEGGQYQATMVGASALKIADPGESWTLDMETKGSSLAMADAASNTSGMHDAQPIDLAPPVARVGGGERARSGGSAALGIVGRLRPRGSSPS